MILRFLVSLLGVIVLVAALFLILSSQYSLFDIGITGNFVRDSGFEITERANYGGEVVRGKAGLEKKDGIVTNIWLRDEFRLDRIREHEIKYLYVDVGDTLHDGSLATSWNEIEGFVRFIQEYEVRNGYNFVLLPYSEINTDDIGITSDFFQSNFIKDYQRLIGLGFDGIYVDIENIRFDLRTHYLNFLEKLNLIFGDNVVIGVYAGHLGEQRNNPWVWSLDFYKAVADRADFIFVGAYDTSLISEESYRETMSERIRIIEEQLVWNADFVYGVPTHRDYPETIEISLDVYEEAHNGNFLGTAIFAEWTTEDDEWQIFESY